MWFGKISVFQFFVFALIVIGSPTIVSQASIAQVGIEIEDLERAMNAQVRFSEALEAERYGEAAEDGVVVLNFAREMELPFSDQVEIAFALASAQEEAGDVAAARNTLREFWLVANQDPALGDIEMSLLSALSEFEARQGNLDDAIMYGERLFLKSATLLGPDNIGSVWIMRDLADLHQARGEQAVAEEYLAGALRIENAPPPPSVVRGIDVIDDPYTLRTVYFGTDRRRQRRRSVTRRYGSRFGQLRVGELTVSIPVTHEIGELESPGWFSFFSQPDPEKHIMVHQIDELSQEDFIENLRAEIAQSDVSQGLLYIHGFRTTFYNGARRAGQLAHDLDFPGPTFYYSWASQGTLLGYFGDSSEDRMESGAQGLRDYLLLLMEESDVDQLHIIAHSMGNRYLLTALEGLSQEEFAVVSPGLENLIFAAPDVGERRFIDLQDMLKRTGSYRTLYVSSNDFALSFSENFNVDRRIGHLRGEPLAIEGTDVMDASEIETGSWGHAYFGDSGHLLTDLAARILVDLPAEVRCGVVPTSTIVDQRTYRLSPDACDVPAYADALQLIRESDLNGEVAQDQATLLEGDAEDMGQSELATHWERTRAYIESLMRRLSGRKNPE